jgi:hypothetical protein
MNDETETQINEGAMKNMLSSLAKAFQIERHKTEPYKELFKAGSTYTGLLRELETQMMGNVLDACDVFKERHGVTIDANQFLVLLCLPFLVKVATAEAVKKEGAACSVDKAYFQISEQLKDLGATP